jgi:membrane protein implicated in regulation of membrane protease activity
MSVLVLFGALWATGQLPAVPLEWTTQVAAACAVLLMAGIFIWYLMKRDERDAKTEAARNDVLTKLAASLDKNTEQLGRSDSIADRWERLLESKGFN